MPCSAKKKNCLASRRCASSIEPETSSAKITAALVAGEGRRTSWRKRRSSLTSEIGSSSAVLSGAWMAWRLTASFMVRRRSRRERAPRLSQPSRMYSAWSIVAVRLGLSSGSLSSSHSQSTISSTFSSTTNRISPSPVPPAWPCSPPSSRPGCSTSPGAPALEQVLLDRVVQRRVGVERELLAALVRAHRLPHHFLAEGELARLGDADLLLHRA